VASESSLEFRVLSLEKNDSDDDDDDDDDDGDEQTK
jgi:hypothetical protein